MSFDGTNRKSKADIFNVPLWQPLKGVRQIFSIGEKRLVKWVGEGLVRSVKLNHSQAGSKLYYCPDINELLLHESAGQRPKIKLGKVTP